MKFDNPYITIKEKIESLQRWIIIQSYLYYETDLELVTDKVYDRNCIELVNLISENQKDFKESMYDHIFYDFDGTTGFDLYYRLEGKEKERIDDYIGNILYAFKGMKNVEKERQIKEKKNRQMVQRK